MTPQSENDKLLLKIAQQAQRIQELEEQRVKYGPICLNCGKDKPCMTEAEASQHGGSTPCTFDPAPKELWQRCKQLQATLAEREAEVGELNVQLRDARQDAARLREEPLWAMKKVKRLSPRAIDYKRADDFIECEQRTLRETGA